MYRRILRLAVRFPSIKRDALVVNIKEEFHENKTMTDPVKIEEKIQIARKGIEQLSMYVNLDPSAQSWSVDMEKDPFGQQQQRPAQIDVKVVGQKETGK